MELYISKRMLKIINLVNGDDIDKNKDRYFNWNQKLLNIRRIKAEFMITTRRGLIIKSIK